LLSRAGQPGTARLAGTSRLESAIQFWDHLHRVKFLIKELHMSSTGKSLKLSRQFWQSSNEWRALCRWYTSGTLASYEQASSRTS